MGNRIRELRKAQGLTLNRRAERVGPGNKQSSHWKGNGGV